MSHVVTAKVRCENRELMIRVVNSGAMDMALFLNGSNPTLKDAKLQCGLQMAANRTGHGPRAKKWSRHADERSFRYWGGRMRESMGLKYDPTATVYRLASSHSLQSSSVSNRFDRCFTNFTSVLKEQLSYKMTTTKPACNKEHMRPSTTRGKASHLVAWIAICMKNNIGPAIKFLDCWDEMLRGW